MRLLDRRLVQLGSGVPLAVVVALGTAAAVATVVQAAALARAVDAVLLGGAQRHELSPFILGFVAAALVRGLCVGLERSRAQAFAGRLVHRLRCQVLAALAGRGPGGLADEASGELQATVVSALDDLNAWFGDYLPQIALGILVPSLVALAVLARDPLSALVLLATAPLIPIFMLLVGHLAGALASRQALALGRLGAYLLDAVQGLVTLKLLGRSKDAVRRVRQVAGALEDSTMRVLRLAFLSALVLELVATLSVAVVAVQIGLRLLSGGLEFHEAFFVLLLAPEFYLPLRLLGQRFHSGSAGAAAAERVFAILDRSAAAPQRNGAPVRPLSPPTIVLAGVCFSYAAREGPRPAIEELDLEIGRGETVALVGLSGAGKSTVLKLLMRFVDPDRGVITADGRAIDRLSPRTWRSSLAWLPQAPYILADTVAANLRLARPAASYEELWEALDRARAAAFVDALPCGLNTVLGERGARLSGGQVQGLALARAFLRDAPVILLDEPATGLDPRVLRELDESLTELLAGRTALVIAHRLATARAARRIVVMQRGKVAETGAYDELVNARGEFERLLRAGEVAP